MGSALQEFIASLTVNSDTDGYRHYVMHGPLPDGLSIRVRDGGSTGEGTPGEPYEEYSPGLMRRLLCLYVGSGDEAVFELDGETAVLGSSEGPYDV